MKIGVTGAGGFVGAHVLRALARTSGHEIVALTRSPLRDPPEGVGEIVCDIRDDRPGVYDRLNRVDLLVHLAWGGLPNYLSFHHIDDELTVQLRFLRRMIEEGLPALQVTGTCYEYGMAYGPQREDMISAPSNPYGFAKATLLRKLQFLRESIPFRMTWARLFYMHGQGQAPGSLYPLLRAAAERGDSRFPMSSGEQLRDYLSVEDVADTLARLAINHQDAGVVNVCSGKPISVRRLVENWIADNGWSIEPDLGRFPYPDYEPLAFWGVRDKLDALLG